MNIQIEQASIHQLAEDEYKGNVIFRLEGYVHPYEISFFSKNGRDWDYSLHFTAQSGNEEEYMKLDERLESDDELFDQLLDAALQSVDQFMS